MRAFIDANVFVHVWTLDALLSAADTGMLEPRWSKDVALEAERAFCHTEELSTAASGRGPGVGVLLGPGVVVHGHQKDRDTEAVDASRGREDHLPTQHCHGAPTTPPVSKPWRPRLHHATI